MRDMINEISFAQINCDFPIRWALFENPRKTKEAKIRDEILHIFKWGNSVVRCNQRLIGYICASLISSISQANDLDPEQRGVDAEMEMHFQPAAIRLT